MLYNCYCIFIKINIMYVNEHDQDKCILQLSFLFVVYMYCCVTETDIGVSVMILR